MAIPTALRDRRYLSLVGALSLVTVLEWALFAVRNQVPPGCIVPCLLGLSCVKFAMVVDWYMRIATPPGWLERLIPTVLVVSGGTALALAAAAGI